MDTFGQEQNPARSHQGIIAYGVDQDVVHREHADKRKCGKKDINKNIEQNIGGGLGMFHLEYGLLSYYF
jgi:hypothetical protein